MTSESPLEDIKGVGAELAKKFKLLGITTVGQLIHYYPRRYEDYSVVTPLKSLRPGMVTIQAAIKQVTGRYVRRGMHITEAIASDATGSTRLVWFNQPYRKTALKADTQYYISGPYELRRQRYSIMNPSVELVSDFPINTARIVPIYRETKGLNSRQIRKVIQQTLPVIRKLPENLPVWLTEDHKLQAHTKAVEAMHFPSDTKALQTAERRLGFEEVFGLVLASLYNKYELLKEQTPVVPFEAQVARQFVKELPFDLTDSQRQVVMQIYKDMEKPNPMNRLVEGDVGAGKTVVAAMAAAMVLHQGHQVAIMAPTELLAQQHYKTLKQLLKPLGYDEEVGLLVGGLTQAEKTTMHELIQTGSVRCIVGTHALIQEHVGMQALELVIVDEQHRFGVEQRKALQAKAGRMPHILSLTATPIPRTLALTLYGDLDISILAQKPHGRKPIITKITSPNSRASVYETIDLELKTGRQMFVVCPLITESGAVKATSAEKVYESFQKKDFASWKVGLLHGKMKAADKQAVMQDFIDHKLDILVSTTVIEVGVDVPNATIMLIEAAERFGLAQIHQLRGRVGRSSDQGYCYLMMSDSSAPSARLRALESSSDGFRLAELDLKLRGPGAIYGQAQHGQLDLRIAKLSDVKLIQNAREAAQTFIDRQENLLQYTELAERIRRLRAVTNLN